MPGKDVKIEILKPNIQILSVKIKGTNNLIFNRWTEKAKAMIRDKQMKKAVKAREAKDPEALYEDSFYRMDDGKTIGFPALNLKQAIVDSARNIESVTMTILRGNIFVMGDESNGLIKVEYKKKQMREDMVRIAMGSADIRYRGELIDWSMNLLIKYNADILSAEQVINLLSIAGFSCGLGEWRPQKSGDKGTFEVASSENINEKKE